jgi:hypothetical protein
MVRRSPDCASAFRANDATGLAGGWDTGVQMRGTWADRFRRDASGFSFGLHSVGVGLGFVFEIDGIAAVSCEVSGPVDIDDFEIQSDSPMTSLIDALLAGKREAYAGDQCWHDGPGGA